MRCSTGSIPSSGPGPEEQKKGEGRERLLTSARLYGGILNWSSGSEAAHREPSGEWVGITGEGGFKSRSCNLESEWQDSLMVIIHR